MTARIKVEAVRAANGRIQGWAVNRGNRELGFYMIIHGSERARRLAMNHAQRIARGA